MIHKYKRHMCTLYKLYLFPGYRPGVGPSNYSYNSKAIGGGGEGEGLSGYGKRGCALSATIRKIDKERIDRDCLTLVFDR